MIRVFRLLVLILSLMAVAPNPAAAQSPYDPVITVNGDAITAWEITQRAGFMKATGIKGDLNSQARKALIDDRLKMAAAKAAGITVPEDELQKGMEAFASSGNVTLDQFRQILSRNGVDYETFRSNVRVQLAWRDMIASKFASQVKIGDSEVDRALTLADQGGLRVLLSEIVVPVPQGDTGQTLGFLKDLRTSLNGAADFEKAARRYSASASRDKGGKLDWIDLSKLPRDAQAEVLGMTPGEISQPIELPQSVALFLLRGLAETPTPPPPVAALDYMLVRLPATQDGLQRAESIALNSNQCSDIYGRINDLPDSDVVRETLAPDKIDPRIRKELALLDPGETSTRLRSSDGSRILLVMLCGRSAAIPQGETRAQIVQKLRNQRYEALANGYLDELRSAATVVNK